MVWHRREIQKQEFLERLLYSLCTPIVRLGRVSKFSLKDLERILRIAYFRALKDEGMSNKEVAEAMGVSTATVARLARETRENFLRPEREHQLPQRIEFMLWAQPMSLARMSQILHNFEPEALQETLDQMVEEGSVELDGDRYALTRVVSRRGRPDWVSRIGALNNLLDTFSKNVHQRFLNRRDDLGFARNVRMAVAGEDIPRLRDLYELVIWPALVALDARAKDRDEVFDIQLALLWVQGEQIEQSENRQREKSS